MNIGGYSAISKELAKEHLEDSKERRKEETLIRKQKIKQLSTQTNKIRRKLEESRKNHEDEEEKRRLRILKMRKIKQDSATEKFQRTPDKKKRDQFFSSVPSTGLKDGNYSVGSHVIEIRNGKRVNPSSKESQQHPDKQQHLINNSKFQNSLYNPTSYLNDHLKNLFDGGSDDLVNVPNHGHLSMQHSSNGYQDIGDHMTAPKSPTDSQCSNDSLSDESFSTRMLRSSLKSSTMMKLTDSLTRKVTFSDSVEFNDGDTKPIFASAVTRVPLYKRIEQNKVNINHEPSAGGRDAYRLQSQRIATTNPEEDMQTTEQLLDQLRQEALLPKFPQNEDFSYPYSVVISQPSNGALVNPPVVSTANERIATDVSTTKSLIDSLSADSLSIASGRDSLDVDEQQPTIEAATTYTSIHNTPVSSSNTPQSTIYSIPTHNAVTYLPRKHQVVVTPSQHNIQEPPIVTSSNRTRDSSYTSQRHTLINGGTEYASRRDTTNETGVLSKNENSKMHKVPSDVVKIHSDTVNPYLSSIVKNSNIDITDANGTDTDMKSPYSNTSVYYDVSNHPEQYVVASETRTEDDLFKNIEASLASVTFENVSNQQCTTKHDKPNLPRQHNHPQGELLDRDPLQGQPESETIINAVNSGSSIPVRVHSGNVRRGRIIVSANEKKRRQMGGNFTPHPPPKAKCNPVSDELSIGGGAQLTAVYKESNQRSVPPTTKQTPKNNRPNTNSKTVQAYSSPRQKSITKNNNKTNSPRVKPQTNKSSVASSPRIRSAPVAKLSQQQYTSSPVAKASQQQFPASPSSVQNYTPSPQDLRPHPIQEYNAFVYNNNNKNNNNTTNHNNRRTSLDKTPTDDEINKLWQNVRACLSSEVQDHAYSDTACHIEQKRYHERTMSGSLIRRSNNYPHYKQQRNFAVPNNKRYGSHETLNRPSSIDSYSSSVSSFSRRQALLPQRTSRILSPKLVTDANKNDTYFRRKTANNIKHHGTTANQRKNTTQVSESMAAFLALEELCNEQSLTPTQTEAVFKASKSLIRKQNPNATPSQKAMSALSLEEERVMKSLDRINERLKSKMR